VKTELERSGEIALLSAIHILSLATDKGLLSLWGTATSCTCWYAAIAWYSRTWANYCRSNAIAESRYVQT